MDTQRHRNYELLVLLAVVIASLVATGINPHSRLTWFSEVLWVLAGIPILVLTYRRFPLTPLLYRLFVVHALILIVGGYYTYARVPLGLWVQDMFDLSRNHYDRLGHFAQGFVPAILARELLLRRSPLVKGKWLFFIVVSVCLAFSAFFEMIEWWYALLVGGESAVDFLGSQGDVWDAQWDMFFALIGAISAQLMLARVHGRSIEKVETGMGQEPTCGENSSS
jgi:putative membrane protein